MSAALPRGRPLRLLVTLLLALAVALAGSALLRGDPADAAKKKKATACKTHKKGKHAKKTKAACKKAKKKTAKKPAAAAAPLPAAAAPATTEQCKAYVGAIDGALGTFIVHLNAAHLETSPFQQVAEAVDVDQYTKTHTVLFENMLAPLFGASTKAPAAVGEAMAAFIAHVNAAHLETGPFQQVDDIGDLEQYTKTHTVLFGEAMGGPLLKWLTESIAGYKECTANPQPGPSPAPAPGPGPSPTPTPAPPAAGDKAVTIAGNKYDPKDLMVSKGTKVTWTNQDSVPHTVTSSGSGPLASPTFNKAEAWSYTFNSSGTFAYYCAVHPDMKATVMVH